MNPDGNNVDGENISLNTLFKFVKPFDGDRQKLIPFLNSIDSAFNLATVEQSNVLLAYVKSQLSGKAESSVSNHDFDTWEELKQYLKSIYSDTKHHGHLLIELLNCRQNTETISQYICKIETALKKLLTSTRQNNVIEAELVGRLAAMNDLALHTFILNVKPEISRMLRARDIETLNEAFNIALEEERIQLLINIKNPNSKNCTICKKSGHISTHCFFNKPSGSKPKPMYTLQSEKVCNYCKKLGHLIQDCRKKKWKDNNRNSLNQNSTRNFGREQGNVNSLGMMATTDRVISNEIVANKIN